MCFYLPSASSKKLPSGWYTTIAVNVIQAVLIIISEKLHIKQYIYYFIQFKACDQFIEANNSFKHIDSNCQFNHSITVGLVAFGE